MRIAVAADKRVGIARAPAAELKHRGHEASVHGAAVCDWTGVGASILTKSYTWERHRAG